MTNSKLKNIYFKRRIKNKIIFFKKTKVYEQ